MTEHLDENTAEEVREIWQRNMVRSVDDNISGRSQTEVSDEGRVILAPLPLLTAEELDLLHEAIKERMHALARVRADVEARDEVEVVALIDHKGQILQSLDTAVCEARGSLR